VSETRFRVYVDEIQRICAISLLAIYGRVLVHRERINSDFDSVVEFGKNSCWFERGVGDRGAAACCGSSLSKFVRVVDWARPRRGGDEGNRSDEAFL
jgi:hypothetical protein